LIVFGGYFVLEEVEEGSDEGVFLFAGVVVTGILLGGGGGHYEGVLVARLFVQHAFYLVVVQFTHLIMEIFIYKTFIIFIHLLIYS